MLHAQADSALPIKESPISLTTAYNDIGYSLTTLKNPINVSFFLYDDPMCKWKKFSIAHEVYKLADLDNAKVRDLNATECRNDGLKSKYVENVRVSKGEWKLRHLVMVGGKLIVFAGNLTSRCTSTW